VRETELKEFTWKRTAARYVIPAHYKTSGTASKADTVMPTAEDRRGLHPVHSTRPADHREMHATLQCHIGTDTLSLARLGARMSGLDFSPLHCTRRERLAHSYTLQARTR
jgi:hypothetical protein